MNVAFENQKNGRRLVLAGVELTSMFLELNGGGYTADQTAKAMEDYRAVVDGEPITIGDVYCYAPEEEVTTR